MAKGSKPGIGNRHHHGNLKLALVEAGVSLLAEGGLEALSLRKCAARAGVSHAAPAHHFKGLKGLLTAIVAFGFETFTRYMVEARDQAANTPRARLEAICKGYIDFSREYEAVATLMFMKERFDTNDPDFQRTSSASYSVLAEACAPYRSGTMNEKHVETLVWSLVQGYVHLARSGMINPLDTPFNTILPKFEPREKSW
jgi:AcrR family transcriptional regulator